jgi:arabinose-5-phosphate isomerase
MSTIIDNACRTFKVEAETIMQLTSQLTADFEHAVHAILKCKGRVILTGMGKSGIIGRKIAASLASTGTPSFYLHPGEAYHGDLGMISPDDIVVAISYSGQTDEVLKIIPFLQDNGNLIVAMTGNSNSTLSQNATYRLYCAVKEEACPLSLAPTSSTTAALALGDALVVALIEERQFKEEDFARFHPGGSLGHRLLTRVGDVMRSNNLPCVTPDMKLNDVILEISNARLGIAVVMENKQIAGIVTDGDVRRAMLQYKIKFFELPVSKIMTRHPKMITIHERITTAEDLMQKNKIHSLIVTHPNGTLAGIVELYDLMK